MKHYVECVVVAPKRKITLMTYNDIETHDLDVLSYLKPNERYLWLEAHKANAIIIGDGVGCDEENEEWLMKHYYGVYIRMIDTHE